MDFFEKRAGVATVGLIGSNALVNYRVGVDYAHSTVHFKFGRYPRSGQRCLPAVRWADLRALSEFHKLR